MRKWRSSVCRLTIDGAHSCVPSASTLPPAIACAPPHRISKLVRSWCIACARSNANHAAAQLYLKPNKRSCRTSRILAPNRAALSRGLWLNECQQSSAAGYTILGALLAEFALMQWIMGVTGRAGLLAWEELFFLVGFHPRGGNVAVIKGEVF